MKPELKELINQLKEQIIKEGKISDRELQAEKLNNFDIGISINRNNLKAFIFGVIVAEEFYKDETDCKEIRLQLQRLIKRRKRFMKLFKEIRYRREEANNFYITGKEILQDTLDLLDDYEYIQESLQKKSNRIGYLETEIFTLKERVFNRCVIVVTIIIVIALWFLRNI